jgi:hypothetical protein
MSRTANFSTSTEQLEAAIRVFHQVHIPPVGDSLLSRLSQKHQKWLLRSMLVLLFQIPLMAVLLLAPVIRGWHLIYLVVVAAAFGASLAWSQNRELKTLLLAHLGTEGFICVKLDDTHAEFSARSTVTRTPWHAYSRVFVSGDFLFLVRGHFADYIPVSAFSSEDDLVNFAAFASAKQKMRDA